MCTDWIRRNVKVYGKDLDLQTAYKIPGLRAVFGESYPDPVRVVSLEYDVDEIAKDIENPKWRQTSIEFCGGTYAPILTLYLGLLNLVLSSDTSLERATSKILLSWRSLVLLKAFVGSLQLPVKKLMTSLNSPIPSATD